MMMMYDSQSSGQRKGEPKAKFVFAPADLFEDFLTLRQRQSAAGTTLRYAIATLRYAIATSTELVHNQSATQRTKNRSVTRQGRFRAKITFFCTSEKVPHTCATRERRQRRGHRSPTDDSHHVRCVRRCNAVFWGDTERTFAEDFS